MALIASDNFNRASLGANWTLNQGAIITVGSATFTPNTLSTVCGAGWNANSFPADQYSQIRISTPANASSQAVGCAVRCATDGTANFYVFYASSTGTFLRKEVAGVDTQLGTSATVPVANDILKLIVQGSSLSCYLNGSLVIGPTTDSALTAGRAGISGFSNSGVPQGDDWEGGDLSQLGGSFSHLNVFQKPTTL